jgi:DNA-binding GntR family transcriptional regulator
MRESFRAGDMATVEQHRALLDCALKRDGEGAKGIWTEHINGCVAHAVEVGRLR